MPTIEFLKNNIDLHDLAEKLGWKRPGGRGNYCSPLRNDKNPSVSINDGGKYFKDFTGAGQGSCIDMIMYHDQTDDVGAAVRRLHELYGWEMETDKPDRPRQLSTVEYIANKCRGNDDQAIAYLTGRGIDADVVRHAIKKNTLGFNTYTSSKHPPGERGHGGPGVAFITRCLQTARAIGVDIRYVEPELNGGLKTTSQGHKHIAPWTSDLARLKKAETVYFFESPINALSFETCFKPGKKNKMAAVAIKGTETSKTLDLQFAIGKFCVLCLDNDETNDNDHCPGPEAAWVLYERLTAMGVAVQIVEQIDWRERDESYNDLNDVLQGEGVTNTRAMLKTFEEWAIPGLAGRQFPGRKNRLTLPSHDYAQYWRFRCKADFTRYITKMREGDDGDETPMFDDLCGFRVASLARITIAGATSVMNGTVDHSPVTLFAVSVQTARHGPRLIKRVFEDEKLHNLNQWGKFGSIYLPSQFNRLIDILERSAHLGKRDAINFVGLAWKQGRLVVNEGHDCYFTEPNKQCTYYNLRFPSGNASQAKQVIQAYQATFGHNAAAMILVWALGGHLKALLGFWPHMIIQADKGSGKSVLVNRLESTLAFKMLSGQSLQTEFRLLTSCSYTSHPVGWEEISARGQQIIDKAVSLLQESYQFTVTYRGADLTEYLICAPVLLAGEDVPVRSLVGKVVRAQLAKKGPHIPDDLPAFPVRQWLDFLATKQRGEVKHLFQQRAAFITQHCRATQDDPGASRIRENYAAMLTAWELLCEFSGIEDTQGGFVADCLAEMNNHIAESVGDRDPWIWIIEIILAEISAKRFTYPYKFLLDHSGPVPVPCLAIRHTHIMQHLRASTHLRDTFNALPIKSNKVLLKQLVKADVLARERIDLTINNHRESHMVALNLAKLGEYGIYTSVPEIMDDLPGHVQAVDDARYHSAQNSDPFTAEGF